MDPQIVKMIVIGVVLFSIFGVAPVIMALLSHQQKMAQLFAKTNLDTSEVLARLELLERKLGATPPALKLDEQEQSVPADHRAVSQA